MDPVVPFIIGVVCITAICTHYLRREPKVLALVYLWSAGVFTVALAAGPSPGATSTIILMDAFLVTGIVFLGAGWWMYGRKEGHLLAIIGWQGFGLYWIMEVPNYISLHPDDPINVILYAPALALFSVFSVHEYRAYRGGDGRKALKFMAGLTSVGAGVYFLFAKVAIFSTALIWATAAQTSWLLNLFGGQTTVGIPAYDPVDNEILVPVWGSSISIILACTGIEAMVIFLGAFIAFEPRKDPWKGYKRVSSLVKGYMKMSDRERRVRALLYTIPPIWALNLVRNVSIIYLVDNEITSFDVAHGYVGKGFSFLVLLALAMIVFDLVPEIYDDLLDLYRLGRPPKKEDGDGGVAKKTKEDGSGSTSGQERNGPIVRSRKRKGAPNPRT
jgi:exosortase/archaeosortase family protein